MRLLLFLALVACSKSSSDKAAKERGPAPGEQIDQGEIVTTTDGKVTANESFRITKTADRLYITTASATTPDAKVRNVQTGQLETDHSYRPLSMSYNYQADKGGFTYELGGSPLTLERKADGEAPKKIEATGPVDVFVEGPGLIAMQALCRVTQPTTLSTISDFESAFRGKVVVKTVTKAASLTKLTIKFLEEFELEVYCDGPKLIASGLRGNKLWNVRKGSEAVFEAARDAT